MNSTHTISERAIERGIEAAIRRELGTQSAEIVTAWGPSTVPQLPGEVAAATITIRVVPASTRPRDYISARVEVATRLECDPDGIQFAEAFSAVRSALLSWAEDSSRVGEDTGLWNLPAPVVEWSDVRVDSQRSIMAYVSFDPDAYLR